VKPRADAPNPNGDAIEAQVFKRHVEYLRSELVRDATELESAELAANFPRAYEALRERCVDRSMEIREALLSLDDGEGE
jgi:hypothetical protein